jgi:hypothetical protein
MIQVLEHFSRSGALDVLANCRDALRKGGSLLLSVPDVEGLFAMGLSGNGSEMGFVLRILYGSEKNPHRFGYTRESLGRTLRETGFSQIEDRPNFHDYPALVMEAVK